MELLFLTFTCVNIAFRAKARGLKPLPWVLRTILAYFIGVFIGVMVIFITWMNKYGSSQKDLERIQAMMQSGELVPNEWNMWFVFVCSLGGYLFVRYRLDKYPKMDSDRQS